MLSFILFLIIVSVVMLSAVMLNVVMLNVILSSVLAPENNFAYWASCDLSKSVTKAVRQN
jgi:hypothetical protein